MMPDRVQELKAFLLMLALGLRHKEVDLLEWDSFDFAAGTLRIKPTQWHSLKTNESAAVLPVEPEILELFRGWRARATGTFVIESNRPLKRVGYQWYRCEETFKNLLDWLRSKAVTGNKPLHQLRKLYGSEMASAHGIHVASSALRPSDIKTTAEYYADSRVMRTAGFGSTLSGASVTSLRSPSASSVRNSKILLLKLIEKSLDRD
jgi:integrase